MGDAVTVPWVAPDQLDVKPAGVDLDECCLVASQILFLLSGRQYRVATSTIRPHAVSDRCACLPRYLPSGMSWTWWDWGRWDGCGCGTAQGLVLAGPVLAVDEVIVDGTIIDPADYRLFGGRRLVRLADPTTGVSQGWPCCQRLDLPTTKQGTWQVSYTYGTAPDEAAVAACREFAGQIALGRANDAKCKLPQRMVSVSRQGVTMNLLDPQKFLDQGRTGLTLVDVWLAAVNPHGRRRRPSIVNPQTITGATV